MKQTSSMRASRCVRGSSPSTLSSPSKEVRPRMDLITVVLPAPFGPLRPTIRPASTLRSTPRTTGVLPYRFVRPRASIIAVIFSIRRGARRERLGCRGRFRTTFHEFFGCEAKARDGRVDLRPFRLEEVHTLVFHESGAGPFIDEHAPAALLLDQLLIDELLVSLENGERIETKFGRYSADRGERVTLFEDTLEDHRHHSIAQLPVDRLAVVPLRVHQSAPVT